MAEKRKLSPSDGSSSAKRLRPPMPIDDDELDETSRGKLQHQQPRSDPTFGQRHAFPGLDDETQDGELFYGPADDGIEYLRMVRSEARNLPFFFVAPEKTESHSSMNDNPTATTAKNVAPVDESQGIEQKWVYSDGVCTFVSNVTSPTEGHVPEGPQEQYYNLLRHRFLLLRSTLKCVPPAKRIAALDSSHPISLPADNSRARLEWTGLVKNVEPRMVQLACMDLDSVLRVLRIVTRSLSEAAKSPSCDGSTRIAAWAWGLLGRCRDVGEMSSEDVGELRDLGKRAAKILSKIRESESQAEASREADAQNSDWDDANVGEGEVADIEDCDHTLQTEGEITIEEAPNTRDDDDEAEKEALELAKRRLQGMLHDNAKASAGPTDDIALPEKAEYDEARKQRVAWKHDARAMLDMIITIVGEFYGQRDLLDLRDIWRRENTTDALHT